MNLLSGRQVPLSPSPHPNSASYILSKKKKRSFQSAPAVTLRSFDELSYQIYSPAETQLDQSQGQTAILLYTGC